MTTSGYISAFAPPQEPFLFHYRTGADGGIHRTEYTRGAFLGLAEKAAGLLGQTGCTKGSRVLHCFGANEIEDLAFRLGAWLIGATPVTVNWQADAIERVAYKLETTGAGTVVFSSAFNVGILSELRETYGQMAFVDAASLLNAAPSLSARNSSPPDPNNIRMIIFTSGTTGMPKGVMLTDENYVENRATFEKMLAIGTQDRFAVLVVNPLHHTNSTAICDWAMRRPGSRIHLVQRYTTPYWDILTQVAERGYDRIVAPTVSRHFDFLEALADEGRLPVKQGRLKHAMGKTDFLIGSAPVGPKTIDCLKRFAGRLPFVRFGATETCLQAIGIPHEMPESRRMENFEKGWRHHMGGEAFPGYYIGQPHPPHTEARIVRSIDRNSKNFMKPVPHGTPGYLIVRGKNLMKGYVENTDATREAFEGDWYLGLKDICFTLGSNANGAPDYFWMSRDAGLMIRGGANYACEQIAAELQDFVTEYYKLTKPSFDLAVVGIKVESEHEDACCVTIELKTETARTLQDTLAKTFIHKARKTVSKGARPDYLRFAEIPKNFKGALLVPELKRAYESYLK